MSSHCKECGRKQRLRFSVRTDLSDESGGDGLCIECWLSRLDDSEIDQVTLGDFRYLGVEGDRLVSVLYDSESHLSPGEGGLVTINGQTFELIPWVPCRNLEDGRPCPSKATHLVSGGRLKNHPVCEHHAESVAKARKYCQTRIRVEPIDLPALRAVDDDDSGGDS